MGLLTTKNATSTGYNMTNSICDSLNSIVDYNEAAIVGNRFIKLKTCMMECCHVCAAYIFGKLLTQ